jgi:hypothetical protein
MKYPGYQLHPGTFGNPLLITTSGGMEPIVALSDPEVQSEQDRNEMKSFEDETEGEISAIFRLMHHIVHVNGKDSTN